LRIIHPKSDWKVSPVLVHGGWQVETVIPDPGTGLSNWIEIRHGDERIHCATAAERDALLAPHGLDLRQFVEVDAIDDGRE
jgi:hypothetical protein